MEESNGKNPPVENIDNENNRFNVSKLSMSNDNSNTVSSDEQQQKSQNLSSAETADFDRTLTNMDSFTLDISETPQDDYSLLNASNQISEKPVEDSNKDIITEGTEMNQTAVLEDNNSSKLVGLISEEGETVLEKEKIAAASVPVPQIVTEFVDDKDGSLPDLERVLDDEDDEMADVEDDAVVEILNRSRSDVEKTRIEKINNLKTCVDDSLIVALQGLNINIGENNETFLSCDGNTDKTITDFLIPNEEVIKTDSNNSNLIDFNETVVKSAVSDDKMLKEENKISHELLLPSPIKELNNSEENGPLDTTINITSVREEAPIGDSTFSTEANKTAEITRINDHNETEDTFVVPVTEENTEFKIPDEHSDEEEFKSLESYNSEVSHFTQPKDAGMEVISNETEEPNEVFYESKEDLEPTKEIVEKVCHFIPCRNLSPLRFQESKVTECDSIRTPVKTAAAFPNSPQKEVNAPTSGLELVDATESDDDELITFGDLDEEQFKKFSKQVDLKLEICRLKQYNIKLQIALKKKEARMIRRDMKNYELVHKYEIYIQKLKVNPNLEELSVIWDVLLKTKQELAESENKFEQLEIKIQEEHLKEIEEIKEKYRQQQIENISLQKHKAQNEVLVKELEEEKNKTKILRGYVGQTCDEIYEKLSEMYKKDQQAKVVIKQMSENETSYKQEIMKLQEKLNALSERALAETNKENQMSTSNQQHQHRKI